MRKLKLETALRWAREGIFESTWSDIKVGYIEVRWSLTGRVTMIEVVK